MGISKKQLLDSIKQIKGYTDKKTKTGAVVPVSYSEEEQIIGEWVNGKPVYEKTIECMSPSSAKVSAEVFDASSLEIDTCIDIQGMYAYDDVNQGINNSESSCWYRKSNKTIVLYTTAASLCNKTTFITIKYTKTTDAKNSFTPDMLLDKLNLISEASEDEVNEVLGGI